MLTALTIRDVVLIDSLELEFGPGAAHGPSRHANHDKGTNEHGVGEMVARSGG